jgi:hypothetical protein
MNDQLAVYKTCFDVTIVAPGAPTSRGVGGMTGLENVVDNLTPAGDTCRKAWAAQPSLPGRNSTTPTSTPGSTQSSTGATAPGASGSASGAGGAGGAGGSALSAASAVIPSSVCILAIILSILAALV